MPPCVFHTMRAFNDQFIISPSGKKNSERELEVTWTERESAPGETRRLKENTNAWQKSQTSALEEPKADVPASIGVGMVFVTCDTDLLTPRA